MTPCEHPFSIQLCADVNTNEVKSSIVFSQRTCGWSDVYFHCYLFPSAKSASALLLLSTEGAQAIFPGVHGSLPGGWDAVQHPSQSQAIGIQEGSIIMIRYITCISVWRVFKQQYKYVVMTRFGEEEGWLEHKGLHALT